MEWISVKERLPTAWDDVLCWCVNEHGETYQKGEWYAAIDRFCIWSDWHSPSFRTDRFFGKVTHWMPLPEPPKKEE